MARKREGAKACLMGNRLFILASFRVQYGEDCDGSEGSTEDIILTTLFSITESESCYNGFLLFSILLAVK
jgi:hypothetical protein